MGEEVGTMQFKVQGEQIKTKEKGKRKKMSIKKTMYEKRKNIYKYKIK
jgi:hypothetical protein